MVHSYNILLKKYISMRAGDAFELIRVEYSWEKDYVILIVVQYMNIWCTVPTS
jgi:hypothetical protein